MKLKELLTHLNSLPPEALEYEFKVSTFEDIDEEYEVCYDFDIVSIDVDDLNKEVTLEIEQGDEEEFPSDLDA